MSKINVITVRIPEDLKKRIEKISKKQGISKKSICPDK